MIDLMATRAAKTKPMTFRLSDDFIKELEAFAQFLAERMPGLEPTTADALRMAAIRGIAELRAELGGKRPGGKKL